MENNSEINQNQGAPVQDAQLAFAEFMNFLSQKKIEIDDSINSRMAIANSSLQKINEIKNQAENSLAALNEIRENLTEADGVSDAAIETLNKAQEIFNKIELISKGAIGRRNEIESIFLEIDGYEEKTGEEEGADVRRIPGLRDKLSTSYSELEGQIKKLSELSVKEYSDMKVVLADLKSNEEQAIDDFKATWSDNLELLQSDIRKLLPDALTAGLSHAYEKRRNEEETTANSHKETFSNAIKAMVALALIPVAI